MKAGATRWSSGMSFYLSTISLSKLPRKGLLVETLQLERVAVNVRG